LISQGFLLGFGYIEYKNSSSVKEAISGMSNFELGGQLLQVAACVSPPEALNYVIPSSTASILPNTASATSNAFTAKIQAQDFGLLGSGSHGILAADGLLPDSFFNNSK